MRWKFIRSSDQAAIQQREAMLQKIAAWWDAFAHSLHDVEAHLHTADWSQLHAWTADHLHAVEPRLSFEFGTDPEEGYYLVITPESAWNLRPMVQTLLQRAPRLAGWHFYGYRPPMPHEAALAKVKDETGHLLSMTTVQPAIGARHRIDLLYQTKLAATDHEAAKHAAHALSRRLLGDDVYYQWIGDIEVSEPRREAGWDRFLLLQRLRPTVLSLADLITKQLPDRPYYQVHTRDLASLPYKLDPPPAEDYAGQADLVVGTSMIAEFRRAVTSPCPFFSASFARHGELFGYLKIDAGELSMDDRLVRRQKWEERIHVPLRKAEAGRIIGSGTGLRYLYYELAISDLPKTIETVRKALVHKGLPDRSWLLFYDAELSGEYIGLRSGSPPPPAEPPKEAKADDSLRQPGDQGSNRRVGEVGWPRDAAAVPLDEPLPSLDDPRV